MKLMVEKITGLGEKTLFFYLLIDKVIKLKCQNGNFQHLSVVCS